MPKVGLTKIAQRRIIMTLRQQLVFNPRIFDEMFDSMRNQIFDSPKSCYPYNIYSYGTENPKTNKSTEYTVIEYALAGFSKNDISVEVDEDLLIIKAKETKETAEKAVAEFYHKGIAKRSLEAKWALMPSVDKDNIKTSYEDGILKIELPHKQTRKSLKLM